MISVYSRTSAETYIVPFSTIESSDSAEKTPIKRTMTINNINPVPKDMILLTPVTVFLTAPTVPLKILAE